MMGGNAAGPRSRLGLVRCEHCQRQFNPHSAARHIPWCKKQQSDAKRHRLTADKLEALERYKWRISYRPTNKCTQANRNADRSTYQGEISDKHQQKRDSSSINSSGALSSPSAGSTSSLSNSTASTSGGGPSSRQNPSDRTNNPSARHQVQASSRDQDAPPTTMTTRLNDKLKRSASSVTLTKSRPTGSASSKNSRTSTTTTTIRTLEPQEAHPSQRQMRCKSVSDLTNMGEIVETLAKRMEQIYAQNQLLLESLMANRADVPGTRCDSRRHEVRDDAEQLDGGYGELEFAQCHHCRAQCLVEANYCHKCGCKMRPSNPTPPLAD